MESRFKIRISRMFRSSFGSCRSRNLLDVIGQPVFVAQNHLDFAPLSPKLHVFPSICKPKSFESATNEVFQRKVSDTEVYFVSGEKQGRTCPPASPISPLNSLFKLHEMEMKERNKKTKKPHHKKKQNKKKDKYRLSFSSGETNNNGWFSSEDETEDETERFFSSKSFSSDSSSSHRRRRIKRSSQRRRGKNNNPDMGICPLVTKGMVEESVAVVKRSSDPYSDFRTSMVEMIIEKQMFSAKDLEKLLQCFLSLNSHLHHRVIVEVFTEIWEALI